MKRTVTYERDEQCVIWITDTFVGFHRWKNAPDEVAFLRQWHRHVFHVRVEFPVEDKDRELEFFIQKQKLNQCLDPFEGQYFEYSCEKIAELIMHELEACEVTVSEDGENGATITCIDFERTEEVEE